MVSEHSVLTCPRYTSADGKNVTVSPRNGVGHVEPKYNNNPSKVTLLAGSGVMNGMMMANVKCADCQKWSGGTMDFSSNTGSWIFAHKSGDALDSDDPNEDISMHDDKGVFNWDFSKAKGGSDVNPFVNAASTSSGSSPSNSSSSSSSSSTTTTTTTTTAATGGASQTRMRNLLIAHGVLASLVFVILLPLGGMLIRLTSFSGTVKLHVAIQLLAWTLFLAAFGIGIHLARTLGYTSNKHPIIGYVVFALLVFQPALGWMHHRVFKRKFERCAWSFGHLTIGRVVIVLGIINGGLGLQLADNASRGALIAYGVVAGVMGISYLAAAVYGEIKRRSRRGSYDSSQEQITNGEAKGGSEADARS